MGDYHQLSAEERLLIYLRHAEGISKRKIAKELARHHTTVARELERNTSPVGYLPDRAHAQAKARRVGTRPWKLAVNTTLRKHVLQKLTLGWSPEQIAGR